MRSLLKAGLVAGFAVIPFVGHVSSAAAQQTNKADELNKRVIELHNSGRYSDAIPIAQQVLAIREKARGRDHPDVAIALNNLALLYDNQGRYADAESLYHRSLVIWEKALGRDHPDVALALSNLAGLYDKQGRYAEAEPLYQRSLAIWEKALGGDHPDVALALNNLAGLYDNQGRYAEAEPLYQRSLAIREKALGRDHPYVGTSLNNLAGLYDNQGRYAEAEPLYQRSLTILEKARGRDHPDVEGSLNNLAELYRNQGRYAEAPLHQRSLAIREKALGRDHPDVAIALNNLVELYRNQGRYGDAEPLHQRSLAIREKALGRDHPDVAIALNNLAELYRGQGRYADAVPIIKRTLLQGTAEKTVAFPVLFASRAQNLVSATQALADSYEIVQRASASAAASAVSKLTARFAAGGGELAQFVRKDQDLTAEAEALVQTVIAFVSKPPAQRSAAAEEQVRMRIAQVKAEREKLQQIFNERFPDYATLSRPQPVSVPDTQALLADDEALLAFDFGDESYAWLITAHDADWTELKVSAKELNAQVQTLRAWLTDLRKRFDPDLAYRIYQATFGVFADQIAANTRLSVIILATAPLPACRRRCW